MEELLGILEETPWWVYVIFVYLIIIGWKATKPQTVSIRKLIILPAILTVWGLMGLPWTVVSLLAWALSLNVGFGLGWLAVRKWKIRYDRSRGTLHLPGTFTTLALALLFFSVKYCFGFYTATHPVIPLEIAIAQAAASGLIAGVFVGRVAFYWKRYEAV